MASVVRAGSKSAWLLVYHLRWPVLAQYDTQERNGAAVCPEVPGSMIQARPPPLPICISQAVREHMHQLLDAKIARSETINKRGRSRHARNPPGPASPSGVVPAAILDLAANHDSGAEDGVRGRGASGAAGSPAPGARAATHRTRTGLQGGARQGAAASGGGRSQAARSMAATRSLSRLLPVVPTAAAALSLVDSSENADENLLLHHGVHGGVGVDGGLLGLSVPPGVEAALMGNVHLHMPHALPPPPPPLPLLATAAGGSSSADRAALRLAVLTAVVAAATGRGAWGGWC